MSVNIKMDSHKLMYHPDVVASWMKGENIFPIELEISLTNACNHRCIFCAVDYTGYQPTMLNKAVLIKNLNLLSKYGTKSVIYAGEGEPLLHKDSVDIINQTKSLGIDVAMSTNGVLLTPDVIKGCLHSLTWVRFSTAGISENVYQNIHQGKKGDLQKVLYHMEMAVREKQDQRLETTLGVQLLLLPENKDEVVTMAKELKKMGVDYFTVKPFSQHPQSQKILQVDYSQMLDIEEELKELETDVYKVYFRTHSIQKLTCKRTYKQCLALPFMTYIDARGSIWPCIVFMGKDEFSYGNLYEKDFQEIWSGDRRKKLIEYFNKMDLEKNCREICRLDEMNQYLDELVHPRGHVNFI